MIHVSRNYILNNILIGYQFFMKILRVKKKIYIIQMKVFDIGSISRTPYS